MRHYANWLEAYVKHNSYSESPKCFHFWTGVAAVAGALRKRVWIDQRSFTWSPNFYIVLVGPPGIAAKSTSVRSGLSLLEQVPSVHFGPESTTWQALTLSLKDAQESLEVAGGKPIWMSCLTIGVSELGTFLRLEDTEFVSVLIDMWDGQAQTWRRKTKGDGLTEIVNPWLNVIACTTPAWLRENFPDSLIGGGLTSRIIFVYGDKKQRLVAYPAQVIPATTFDDERRRLLDDLVQISLLAGEYTITPEALEWGTNYYHNVIWADTRPAHLANDRLAGYLARKWTHLHKLAMVFAASKRAELTITKEDLVQANTALSYVEQDLAKVFSHIGTSPSAKAAGEILNIIKNVDRITYGELWRMCFSTYSARDFSDAMQSITNAGYVSIVQTGADRKLWTITYLGPNTLRP